MDNVTYEITHAYLVRVVAKQLGIQTSQIDIVPLTAEETSAVKAMVRTDLTTAGKIERKLKKLEGAEAETQE